MLTQRQGWSHRLFFWVVSMNEKVIKQFHRLALLISYNGMLCLLFREAFSNCPHQSWLRLPLCSHGILPSSKRAFISGELTLKLLGISCPLDYDLLEDRVVFSLLSSSPSTGVPGTSQGFNKCLLNWINWVCIARSSLLRLVLNGISRK